MKKWGIFCLTHFYPLFIALHLYFGDWCRVCQAMFTVVPLLVFGGLLSIWANGVVKIDRFERSCINYLLFNLYFITGYYILCIFSLPEWVYNKNGQACAFILITLTFYTLKHCGK